MAEFEAMPSAKRLNGLLGLSQQRFRWATYSRWNGGSLLNLSIVDTINRSYQALDDTTGTMMNSTLANFISITTGFNHNFIPDRLVGTLFFMYTIDTNANNQFDNPVRDTTTRYSSIHSIECRLANVC